MTSLKTTTLLSLSLICSILSAKTSVYLASADTQDGGIFLSYLDETSGDMSAPRKVANLGNTRFLAQHPELPVIYAAHQTSIGNFLIAFNVTGTGSLNSINQIAIGDDRPAHINIHPDGDFLVTAQYGGGTVYLFTLEENGAIGDKTQTITHSGETGPNEKRQNAAHPHWVGFSDDGKFAFVPDLGLDSIEVYTFDNGQLSTIAPIVAPPGSGPRHIRIAPDGKTIYLNHELSVEVGAYSWYSEAAEGKLIGSFPAIKESEKKDLKSVSTSELEIHPNDSFVFTAIRGHDSITAFKTIPASGSLEKLGNFSLKDRWPRHFSISASGKHLIVGGARSHTVSSYAIDPKTAALNQRH